MITMGGWEDYKKGYPMRQPIPPVSLSYINSNIQHPFTASEGVQGTKPNPDKGLGIFFSGDKNRIRVTETHECAEIPGALIAQGSWGNRQNGIAIEI
jgi:hypothetical protein